MTSIAVIGTGNVGKALATGLHRAGHLVTVGRRKPTDADVDGIEGIDIATVTAAIGAADVVINATPGDDSVARFAPLADLLGRRILVDVSNGLRAGTAAALQLALPQARVVKTLSTVLFAVMANPNVLSVPATVFLSGDDPDAKDAVRGLLTDLDWATEHVLDLGGVDTATSVEATYPLAMAALRAHGLAPFALTAVF